MKTTDLMNAMKELAEKMKSIMAEDKTIISISNNVINTYTWRGFLTVHMDKKGFFEKFADKEYEFIRADIADGTPFLMVSHLDGDVEYHAVITEAFLDRDGELVG